ncbi:lysophospholipid acyltransferase family protein [Flammeovirgaceae bacterium SG7u.111]|nr:lysophospholipid acyltransferase family protein [Flammeovirgaceae bacterium SG7u.132]WPO37947.1 lysophospholipid acyltransferase family protein [Flammeovirgaceae bacterium SG7u.111]
MDTIKDIRRRAGKRNLRFKLIKKDPFGNVILFKRMLIGVLGTLTYGRFNLVNSLKVEGTEYLMDLPQTNVMFISNHQTYYSDVMAFYHIFCSVKWRFKDNVNMPIYMLIPRANTYYVAAEETMKDSGLFPRILSLAGAVTVKRSWRAKGQNVARSADRRAPEKIKKALDAGWVINFPQGTTSPYAPVRKGTAHLIKSFNPIVVPVVINGFRRAFDKKGLYFKKRGTKLSVKFKEPITFPDDEPIANIMKAIEKAIEQRPLQKED